MDFALRLPPAGTIRSLAPVATVFAILAAAGCGADAGEETALLRGDRAFAHGDYEEALAEYRLSMLRDNPGGEAEMRAAHAYAALNRIDEASSLYQRAVRGDSAYADQAVSDLVAAAIRAQSGGDRYGMASAIEAAQSLRRGIVVEELALALARHYSETGQSARARPLYLRASGGRIPELKRVIIAYQNQIVMEETLDQALARLFGTPAEEPAASPPATLVASASEDASSLADPLPAGGTRTLAQQANEHYSRAMQAQRQGDWASYGAEIELLGDVLAQLDGSQGQN